MMEPQSTCVFPPGARAERRRRDAQRRRQLLLPAGFLLRRFQVTFAPSPSFFPSFVSDLLRRFSPLARLGTSSKLTNGSSSASGREFQNTGSVRDIVKTKSRALSSISEEHCFLEVTKMTLLQIVG